MVSYNEQLSPGDIKRILAKYGVTPSKETKEYMIFPTVCHNLHGGSDKLYYYYNSKLFTCFTNCGTFDILKLIMKMNELRGKKINYYQAIQECGLTPSSFLTQTPEDTTKEDIEYLYNLLRTKSTTQITHLPSLDNGVLNRYVFDMKALKIWEREGISYNTMLKYHIRYDPIENCIIIPNYDMNGNLISIRGRYFSGDAKYKPIIFGGKVLSHPSSMNLYGLFNSQEAISRSGRVIVFEGEKSTLKMDTIYDDNNPSVATLGKNLSMQQVKLLRQCGATEFILAYDADYQTYDEMAAKRQEYINIVKPLKTFFNVAIIMDEQKLLGYKDSPIDKGKEVFEKLFKNRLYI